MKKNKYQILCVCVCVCILALVIWQGNLYHFYAVLCHSRTVCLRHILPHYLTNGMIFGKKIIGHEICVLFFPTTSV